VLFNAEDCEYKDNEQHKQFMVRMFKQMFQNQEVLYKMLQNQAKEIKTSKQDATNQLVFLSIPLVPLV